MWTRPHAPDAPTLTTRPNALASPSQGHREYLVWQQQEQQKAMRKAFSNADAHHHVPFFDGTPLLPHQVTARAGVKIGARAGAAAAN